MNSVDEKRSDLPGAAEGEFVGWQTGVGEKFEDLTGPFWQRTEPDGRIRCAFRVQQKHLSAAGYVHGGCFMTFADYCLFAIARPVLERRSVTVSFSCDFLSSAREGELIEGTGEVTHAGGSLIFVRGELKSAERRLFTFSASLKQLKSQPRNDSIG